MLSAALELLEVVVFNRLLSLTDCINKELKNKRFICLHRLTLQMLIFNNLLSSLLLKVNNFSVCLVLMSADIEFS